MVHQWTTRRARIHQTIQINKDGTRRLGANDFGTEIPGATGPFQERRHEAEGDNQIIAFSGNKHLIFNRNCDVFLQCLGVIESVYWKSNEESMTGDKQKASTLEVKKPVSATSTSNTRADRVHGELLRNSID